MCFYINGEDSREMHDVCISSVALSCSVQTSKIDAWVGFCGDRNTLWMFSCSFVATLEQFLCWEVQVILGISWKTATAGQGRTECRCHSDLCYRGVFFEFCFVFAALQKQHSVQKAAQ